MHLYIRDASGYIVVFWTDNLPIAPESNELLKGAHACMSTCFNSVRNSEVCAQNAPFYRFITLHPSTAG